MFVLNGDVMAVSESNSQVSVRHMRSIYSGERVVGRLEDWTNQFSRCDRIEVLFYSLFCCVQA